MTAEQATKCKPLNLIEERGRGEANRRGATSELNESSRWPGGIDGTIWQRSSSSKTVPSTANGCFSRTPTTTSGRDARSRGGLTMHPEQGIKPFKQRLLQLADGGRYPRHAEHHDHGSDAYSLLMAVDLHSTKVRHRTRTSRRSLCPLQTSIHRRCAIVVHHLRRENKFALACDRLDTLARMRAL